MWFDQTSCVIRLEQTGYVMSDLNKCYDMMFEKIKHHLI